MGRECIADKFRIETARDLLSITQCDTITGDVEIANYDEPTIHMERVQVIDGSLVVVGSPSLMRLSANVLRTITHLFRMENLHLMGLVELPALEKVAAIEWRVLPLLSQATLGPVRGVESVVISDTLLTEVLGISAKHMLHLDINNNRFLEHVSFDVERVSHSVNIAGNAFNLAADLSRLKLTANMSISNVMSLDMASLEEVRRSVSVVQNLFANVLFPALTRVSGSFRLGQNPSVTSAAFPLVEEVGGGVLLVNNTQLAVVDCFPNLTSIGGALELAGPIKETSWNKLKLVKGSIGLETTDPDFDCDEWVSGPIHNALRGGEISCHNDRPTTLYSVGAQPLTGDRRVPLGAWGQFKYLLLLALLLAPAAL